MTWEVYEYECEDCEREIRLAMPGNLWGRNERVCDGCYDRLESMRL